MRSIRLSLMVYFLGLLAVALGVASLLVYRSAQQTLREKEQVTSKLIQSKFEQRVVERRRRLDDSLLDQASALAGRLKIVLHWNRYSPRDRGHHVLGVLTAGLTPSGYASVAPWLAQFYVNENRLKHRMPPSPAAPFAAEIWRSVVADLNLVESDLNFPAGRGPDYFQVDTNRWGKPLRSASLNGRSFPDPSGFGGAKLVYWEADNVELAPGHWVRRVRVKASSAKRESVMRPPPPPGGGPPMPPPGPPRGSPPRPPSPRSEMMPVFIVLQVAADLGELNAAIGQREAERDRELEALKSETARTLLGLRNRLLAISSVTFVATVLGSFWLVWLGLRPLHRVGEAVSQVSPRDFRLRLDGTRLPAELLPIVERLTAALELLKRAFAREKQATADISHELRTPLAAMLTNLELALRKPRPAEQYRDLLHECRGSAQHMHQIVERLLTLARLDAGVDRLRPQPVDVGELAAQCASVVRPLAEARGLTLEFLPADAARTDADPDKLREVLNNLLHNAIQYNRPDGRIELSVGRSNGHLRLEVSDTGIGIPPEARERIFERFYRADPSRAGDGLNAGLGLAIVKEYVDLMGGRISVESREGQGSTFRVELPVPSERLPRRQAEAVT